MKTLILSDETWAAIEGTLAATPFGPELLARLAEAPAPLPSDRELRAMARVGERPQTIARAVAYRDAGRQAQADTREAAEELLRSCHDAGIGPATLARWFELAPSRVYEVLGERVAR